MMSSRWGMAKVRRELGFWIGRSGLGLEATVEGPGDGKNDHQGHDPQEEGRDGLVDENAHVPLGDEKRL
jgi:hypothetical protein